MPSLFQLFIIYLKSNTVEVPEKWITKKRLSAFAYDRGFSSNQVWQAIQDLKDDVRIGVIWNGKIREEEYMYYNFTEEEIASKIEDEKWFEALPG